MAITKSISHTYKKQSFSLIHYLKKAENLKNASIHKLRVDIKNLRVLLLLLEIVSGEKKNASLKNLTDPVFKQAGKLRTNSLNIKLTEAFPKEISKKFKNYLEKKNKKIEKKFLKKIAGFKKKKFESHSKSNEEILKKIKPYFIKQKAINYINGELLKIKTDLLKGTNNEILHDIRKKLKNIKTTESFLKKTKLIKQNSATKKLLSNYERVGKWHDSLVFSVAMEKFLKSTVLLNKESMLPLQKLKQKINMTKILILKKLKADLV